MGKIRVKDKRGYSYLRKDVGKPGKTPKSERWFEPGKHTGWEADMPAAERRELVLEAFGGDYLAAARSKQELANVTTDRPTKVAALADARYFFRQYRLEG